MSEWLWVCWDEEYPVFDIEDDPEVGILPDYKVELPDGFAERFRRAEAEWRECQNIIQDACQNIIQDAWKKVYKQ